MTSSSSIINKAFRGHLSPALRTAGFEKVDARNGWAWKKDCIWVLTVRAVGSYFSAVTGWPPSSVGVSLGAYYPFIPRPKPVKNDKDGRLIPAEYECHMRSHLERRLLQDNRVTILNNPAERSRQDLWWIDRDGANADEVALDIVGVFTEIALPWFDKCADLEIALSAVEAERDHLDKFVLAAYLAGKLGRSETREKCARLAEQEGQRIGVQPDKEYWFSIYGR